MPRPKPTKTDKLEAARKSAARAQASKARYAKPPDKGKAEARPAFSSDQIIHALGLNQRGEADLLHIAFHKQFLFDHRRREWFFYAENHWQRDVEQECIIACIRALSDAYTEEIKRQAAAHADPAISKEEQKKVEALLGDLNRRKLGINTIDRAEKTLRLATAGRNSLATDGESWNRDPWLFQCRDTVIDLKTGLDRLGVPEDLICKVAPTPWKGLYEPAPTWEKFVSEIFNGKADMVSFVQKILGTALIGKQVYHHFYIFYGEGRNGKGTLVETISDILGSDLSSPIRSEILIDQRFKSSASANPELLQLQGTLLVWASETKEQDKLDTAAVKGLTGGDKLTGRMLYSNNTITFLPAFTLFLLTNHKPRISPTEIAFWSRAKLVPFSLKYLDHPEQSHERKIDYFLKDKLLAEGPGILAWLVRGCLDAQREGLEPPPEVKAATDQYRTEDNRALEFVEDCCVKDASYESQAQPLYKAFLEWHTEMYTDKSFPPSLVKWSEALAVHFPRQGKKDGRRHTYFKGIALKSDRVE